MSFFVTPVTDEYGEVTYNPTVAGNVALVIVMLAVLLIGVAFFGKSRKTSAKQLAFSSVAIALSMVTSLITLVRMPMGGSVTLLSMFFITLVGYWYGLGAGLTASVAYGVLQLIIGPYILTIPQMVIDYIFAFGALGLSGIFSGVKNGLTLGYIAGVLGRYFFAFLSGWIFFGTYAGDYGFHSAVAYSLAYNGLYIGVEAAITIVLINLPPVKRGLAAIRTLAVEQ